jgi:hypothetical protein
VNISQNKSKSFGGNGVYSSKALKFLGFLRWAVPVMVRGIWND